MRIKTTTLSETDGATAPEPPPQNPPQEPPQNPSDPEPSEAPLAVVAPEPWTPRTMSREEEDRRWEELDRRVQQCGATLSKRLTKEYFRAKEEFAQLMSLKLTPEIMGVNLVETSEILQDGIREAGRAMETSLNVKDKVDALLAITMATRAQAEIIMKMSKLYRAGQKVVETPRPRMNQAKAPSSDVPFIVAQNVEINSIDPAKNDTAGQG